MPTRLISFFYKLTKFNIPRTIIGGRVLTFVSLVPITDLFFREYNGHVIYDVITCSERSKSFYYYKYRFDFLALVYRSEKSCDLSSFLFLSFKIIVFHFAGWIKDVTWLSLYEIFSQAILSGNWSISKFF